jgi:hypothetical protein
MPHGGSSDTAQAHPPQPLKSSAEDMADAVSEPVATGSVVGAKADVAQQASASDRTDSSGASTATTTSTTSAVTAASTTTGSGRHARAGGTWDTNDWQEAIARAAAAQRAAQQDQTGRHRAPTGFGYQSSPDSQGTLQH